jgi:outer membrane usher protein FimD/PapC
MSANLDVGVHDSGLQEAARLNVSGSLGFRPRSGFGFNVSGSYWDGDRSSTYTLRPGVNRRFGDVAARAWYTFYRSNEPEAATQTHTVAASLSAPLSPRVRGEISGRIQRGTILRGSRIYASIRWAF